MLSYTIVFLGLYAAAATRSRPLARLGLGAGLLAALLDGIENAFFITYALLSRAGTPLSDPALPAIYLLANLKWMVGFVAFSAFGLAWPRDHWRGWLITAIALAFSIVGLLALLFPVLVEIRGAFLLLGMPIFAWDFWERSHRRSQ